AFLPTSLNALAGWINSLLTFITTKITKATTPPPLSSPASRGRKEEGVYLRVLRGESAYSPQFRLGYVVAMVGFLLAGCAVGPDYRRPTVMVPDNHRGVVGAPVSESLADLPWWELFKDPVLQELTREALRNNYDLRTAAARVEEARAQIGVSRSFFYPQINFNGGGRVQQGSPASEPPQSFGHNRTFQNWIKR